MSAQAATMSTTNKIEPKPPSTAEVNPPQPEDDPPPPPPPNISSPEPPPPPRIFAEDLKRSSENRKRKASPDISDRKGGALYCTDCCGSFYFMSLIFINFIYCSMFA